VDVKTFWDKLNQAMCAESKRIPDLLATRCDLRAGDGVALAEEFQRFALARIELAQLRARAILAVMLNLGSNCGIGTFMAIGDAVILPLIGR